MRWFLLFLCLAVSASAAQVPIYLRPGMRIDTFNSATPATNPATIVLSTTQRNDLIIVATNYDASGSTGVTDTAGLTWTKLVSVAYSAGAEYLDIWYAVSTGLLSSDTISISYASVSGEVLIQAFSVTGAKTSSPFNGTPGTFTYTGSTTGGASVTTTIPNAMIIGAFNQNTEASPTSGTGWHDIVSNTYCLVNFMTVGGVGTYTPQESPDNSDIWVNVAFAIAPG